jgi:hypothetical protein
MIDIDWQQYIGKGRKCECGEKETTEHIIDCERVKETMENSIKREWIKETSDRIIIVIKD